MAGGRDSRLPALTLLYFGIDLPNLQKYNDPVMTVQGIDNIGICTTDLTRSVAFYKRLGFTEAYRNDRGVMMAAGTVQLFLFQVRQPNPAPVGRELGLFGNPPGLDHISFSVSNVDALYAELCKAGVPFAGPPENQTWGARMVALKDPDGNNIYLLQRL